MPQPRHPTRPPWTLTRLCNGSRTNHFLMTLAIIKMLSVVLTSIPLLGTRDILVMLYDSIMTFMHQRERHNDQPISTRKRFHTTLDDITPQPTPTTNATTASGLSLMFAIMFHHLMAVTTIIPCTDEVSATAPKRGNLGTVDDLLLCIAYTIS